MATKLRFLGLTSSTNSDYSRATNQTKLNGSASGWGNLILSPSAFSTLVSDNYVVNTVTGPTAGLEVTNGTLPYEWWSPPIDADVTISGSISWSLWALELAMTNNAAINGQIWVADGATGNLTLIDTTARTTELGTSSSAQNFSETPAAGIACKRGDRLRAVIFADDAGTMASGGTVTFWAPGDASENGNGDSWVEFTEDITFASEPAGTTIYLTDSASPVATAAVDRIAWTSRGAGVQTDVRNTAAGWTAPLQMTDTAGGTVVDWWTNTLPALTLGGAVRCNVRAQESSASANASIRCEIAVANGDGSSPVVWALGGNGIELGTSESAQSFLISGDDVSVSAGQRLRIRIYIDDTAQVAMATAFNTTLYYAGTSGGASGDTYLTFTTDLNPVTDTSFPYIGGGYYG